ncbi:MAG: cytochrome c-type biogenesis protein CcmH [Inquilinus sp.]|nr:cytochrome c-type biogenesis protein CcmH [Inquilinus sp.]
MSARRLFVAALLLALLGPATALAVNPDERLDDPALEGRARALSQELRCLVCQNQSIDDSDADLARDLRILVRQRLVAGDSDTQVLAFVTARYGDYVLLRPPVQPNTYALWFAPLVIALIGALGLAVLARRRRGRPVEPDPLTPEERAKVEALLAEAATTGKEPAEPPR